MADNTAKRYLDLEGLKTFYDLLVGKFADKSELVTLKNSLKDYITTAKAQELVETEIAKVVNGAPETFDTLREIAEWIANHPNLDEALGSEIDALGEKIETLRTSVGGLTTKVSDVEAKASENASAIEEVKGALDGKASSSDLSALDGRVQTVEGSVSTLSNTVTNLGTSVEGLESKVAELEGNLGEKNVIKGIKLNGTLVEPNEDKIVELTVEGGSAETISMTTTQSLGGIKAGKVYENASIARVLEDLLAPYVAFKGLTISAEYDSFPVSAITYKEKGETVKINKLSASWTQGSRDIKNVSIYNGSISLSSYINGTAPSSALLAEFNSSESNKIIGSFEASINEVVLNSGESKTFTVFVRDTDDLNGVTVEKATVTITNKAYIPVFYGVLPKSAYPFSVENITGLRKAQVFPTPVNFGDVSADSYIVVATQKPLKSAVDKSNLENIDLFDSEDMVLSTSLWSNETFHVYRTYTKTQLDNWTFKFTV